MSAEKPTLDDLVRDAKAERGPDVDWEKVEAKLFPRVEREARAQAALRAYAGPRRVWVAAAVVIAAAAAVPLFLGRGPARPLDGDVTAESVREPSAGTLAQKDTRAIVHAASGAKGGATWPRATRSREGTLSTFIQGERSSREPNQAP